MTQSSRTTQRKGTKSAEGASANDRATASKKTAPVDAQTNAAARAATTSKKVEAPKAATQHKQRKQRKATSPKTPGTAPATADTAAKPRNAESRADKPTAVDVAPEAVVVESSRTVLAGVDCGASLYTHGMEHMRRMTTCWTRYCEDLAGAQSGLDLLQAHETFMRQRYDDVARDSIAAAALLLETGSRMTDRLVHRS